MTNDQKDEAMFWVSVLLLVAGAKVADSGHFGIGLTMCLFGVSGAWLSRQSDL